jgi:large subunit ribosomal protein L6
MSRIGKLPIRIPQTVQVLVKKGGSVLNLTGKFGSLEIEIPEQLQIVAWREFDNETGNVTNGFLNVSFKGQDSLDSIASSGETRTNKSLQGLYRTLINNMVIGVTEQFSITLVLQGVGYRASVQGESLILNLGFSHPVEISIPEGITVEVVQNTTINLKACDKEQLGFFAAKVRSWRPPEPYKGKGILYKDEKILRKAGKSGKK